MNYKPLQHYLYAIRNNKNIRLIPGAMKEEEENKNEAQPRTPLDLASLFR